MRVCIAATAAALILLAGCSSANSPDGTGASDGASPTTGAAEEGEGAAPADPAAEVDEILDNFSVAVLSLTDVPADSSLTEILTSYRGGVTALDRMAALLADGVADVPSDITSAAFDSATASSTALQGMIDCFETSMSAGECDAEISFAGERNYELGQAAGALIPYGTRTEDAVLALLEPQGSTPAESSSADTAAAAPVPTSDTGDATFTVDCYDATYTTYSEAWVTEHDDCEGSYVSGTPSDVQREAAAVQAERKLEKLSPIEIIKTLEYVYGMCAQSGPESYDYLVVDEVDRRSQAAEFQAALMICPDHPDAEEITERVTAVVGSASGPRDIFGGGLQRVGKDIQPGTYVSKGNSGGCYWERLDRNGNILDNNFTNGSRVQVSISSSDFEFNSDNCNTWRKS